MKQRFESKRKQLALLCIQRTLQDMGTITDPVEHAIQALVYEEEIERLTKEIGDGERSSKDTGGDANPGLPG